MKTTLTLMAAVIALSLSTGGVLSADNPDKEQLDKRIHQVNDTVKKRNLTSTALKHISVETGVPQAQVEAMHKGHPDTGPAGLLTACVLADETKKAPETFVKQHNSGKSWASMARENQVPLDKLSARLDRLEATFSNVNEPVEKKAKK